MNESFFLHFESKKLLINDQGNYPQPCQLFITRESQREAIFEEEKRTSFSFLVQDRKPRSLQFLFHSFFSISLSLLLTTNTQTQTCSVLFLLYFNTDQEGCLQKWFEKKKEKELRMFSGEKKKFWCRCFKLQCKREGISLSFHLVFLFHLNCIESCPQWTIKCVKDPSSHHQ